MLVHTLHWKLNFVQCKDADTFAIARCIVPWTSAVACRMHVDQVNKSVLFYASCTCEGTNREHTGAEVPRYAHDQGSMN